MAARKTSHHTQPDKEPAASPGRFGLLLIVLILTYLLSAFATGRWIDALRLVLFTGAALLALRSAVVLPHRTGRLILKALLAGSAIMLALSFATETGTGIASIWAGLVLLLAVVVIVHRVLSFTTVTIFGPESCYPPPGFLLARTSALPKRDLRP